MTLACPPVQHAAGGAADRVAHSARPGTMVQALLGGVVVVKILRVGIVAGLGPTDAHIGSPGGSLETYWPAMALVAPPPRQRRL